MWRWWESRLTDAGIFPYQANRLIRKNLSLPARKTSSCLAHLHRKNKSAQMGANIFIGGDGGNRTRVQRELLDKSTCVFCPIGFKCLF